MERQCIDLKGARKPSQSCPDKQYSHFLFLDYRKMTQLAETSLPMYPQRSPLVHFCLPLPTPQILWFFYRQSRGPSDMQKHNFESQWYPLPWPRCQRRIASVFTRTGNICKKPHLSVAEHATVEITVGSDHHLGIRNSSSLCLLLPFFWKLHRRGQGSTPYNKLVEHK